MPLGPYETTGACAIQWSTAPVVSLSSCTEPPWSPNPLTKIPDPITGAPLAPTETSVSDARIVDRVSPLKL